MNSSCTKVTQSDDNKACDSPAKAGQAYTH